MARMNRRSRRATEFGRCLLDLEKFYRGSRGLEWAVVELPARVEAAFINLGLTAATSQWKNMESVEETGPPC